MADRKILRKKQALVLNSFLYHRSDLLYENITKYVYYLKRYKWMKIQLQMLNLDFDFWIVMEEKWIIK